MKINNLKYYSNNKIKKMSTKLVALSLVGSSIIALGGCGSSSKKEEVNVNPSIIDIIDCLSSVNALTLTDEDMNNPIIMDNGKISDINTLYNQYNEAVKNGDKDKANEALYYMGRNSLQSLIADTYNIPFDKIEGLNVFIVPARRINKKNTETYDYPIKFIYNDVYYTLLPHDKLARELAYSVSKTGTNSLDFSSEYCNLYDAYNIIKASLLFMGDKEDILIINDGKKDNYYGSLYLSYNFNKLDVYYDTFTIDAKDGSLSYDDSKKLVKKL